MPTICSDLRLPQVWSIKFKLDTVHLHAGKPGKLRVLLWLIVRAAWTFSSSSPASNGYPDDAFVESYRCRAALVVP